MLVSHIALISQTARISFGQLAIASAALQKQVTRDFSPIWSIEADLAPFQKLEDAPLGYWKIIIRDDIPFDAQGIHLNRANGQPFALVPVSVLHSPVVDHGLQLTVSPNAAQPRESQD